MKLSNIIWIVQLYLFIRKCTKIGHLWGVSRNQSIFAQHLKPRMKAFFFEQTFDHILDDNDIDQSHREVLNVQHMTRGSLQ